MIDCSDLTDEQFEYYTMHTPLLQYQITYGIKQGRGGYLITEQMLTNAKDETQAYAVAGFNLKRGEAVLSVEQIK